MPQVPDEYSGKNSDMHRKKTKAAALGRKERQENKVIQKKDKARKRYKNLTPRPTLSQMDYGELKVAKNAIIEKKQFDIAPKYLNRMITLCEDLKEKAELLVELADIHFDLKDFSEAKKWYLEFERLYPGNRLIEQAKYKIILCSKEKLLSADRDQEPTEETLKLAQEYLNNDTFQQHRAEMNSLKKECESLLAQSDCGVASFYLKQGDYLSAQKRVTHVRNEWLEKVPEIHPTLAQLEVNLGTEWKEFAIPEESLKLTQASNIKPNGLLRMTHRF